MAPALSPAEEVLLDLYFAQGHEALIARLGCRRAAAAFLSRPAIRHYLDLDDEFDARAHRPANLQARRELLEALSTALRNAATNAERLSCAIALLRATCTPIDTPIAARSPHTAPAPIPAAPAPSSAPPTPPAPAPSSASAGGATPTGAPATQPRPRYYMPLPNLPNTPPLPSIRGLITAPPARPRPSLPAEPQPPRPLPTPITDPFKPLGAFPPAGPFRPRARRSDPEALPDGRPRSTRSPSPKSPPGQAPVRQERPSTVDPRPATPSAHLETPTIAGDIATSPRPPTPARPRDRPDLRIS